MSFSPTNIRAEKKSDRMVAIYATVDGEEVFLGSSLNSKGHDAADKMAWIVEALVAHHRVADMSSTKDKPAKKKKSAAKSGPGTKLAAPAAKKPLKKIGKK